MSTKWLIVWLIMYPAAAVAMVQWGPHDTVGNVIVMVLVALILVVRQRRARAS